MARKKIANHDIEQIIEVEDTIFFRVKRPLTDTEYKLLSARVRNESEITGVKIVLVPHTCDLDLGGDGT